MVLAQPTRSCTSLLQLLGELPCLALVQHRLNQPQLGRSYAARSQPTLSLSPVGQLTLTATGRMSLR